MKNMTKVLVGAVVAAILAVGCGGEETTSEDSDAERFELRWATSTGYSPQSPISGPANYISGKVSEFEEDFPHVDLNIDIQSSNIDEAMSRLIEQANTGRAPDVAAIDGYLFQRYIEYLQPLDDLMEEYGIEADDFLPFAQDVITGPDGKVYGLYMGTDTRVLFYNTEVVSEPPTTWEEAMQISLEIQEDGYNGLIFPGGRGEGASITTLWPLFWAQGGELVDEDGTPVFGEGENREKMLNVLSTIEEAVTIGAAPQRLAGYGAEGDLNQEIATGSTAMFLGGNWQEAFLKETLGEEEFAKWDVAPLPQLEEGLGGTAAGGWTWGIFTEDEEKKRAAFDLIARLFITEQAMGEFQSVQGGLPTRSSVYDSEYYEGTRFSSLFREYLEDANVRPSSPHYNTISIQMQIALSDVISGNKSAEEALDDAWKVVNNE
ncbi:extracellular solute-binding protein [Halalkalibacter kiskunsagensis]|uniref:Extracellular solute-binding protein n=1 Tax=Halalkalibacter kiskunsagensis TaxID=1548599 RepID=A0ABV6K974_9BACI